MGLSNSNLFFVRHGDDNGVYLQNCRCNRENDDCISPLVTQHSYGKLHIYLWFTHSWLQMVYLIAMVVTFIWWKRHRFGENKNLAGKKQKWWWCSFICSLVMTNDLFATCYIVSVFQLQGKKMSIKLNESQHVQRCFSAKTPWGCGASWQKIDCRWEFQQAVAVAVPSDIQTLHLTNPRVSPNTPAGWWFETILTNISQWEDYPIYYGK
jgi:hypothetical protein